MFYGPHCSQEPGSDFDARQIDELLSERPFYRARKRTQINSISRIGCVRSLQEQVTGFWLQIGFGIQTRVAADSLAQTGHADQVRMRIGSVFSKGMNCKLF